MNKTAVIALMSFLCAGSLPAEKYTPKTYIKAVFSASLSLRQSEQTFRQAENTYKSALLDSLLPSMTLSMSDSLYDKQTTSWRFNKNEVSSTLSATWNLYDSASSPMVKIKNARLTYESAELTFLTAKQTLALKALNKFYALYSTQQYILTAKGNLASRERQFKDTNEQYQTGTRSKTQVTQSEGDKLQSELSLAKAQSAERQARFAFNELINVDPFEPQEVEISTSSVNVSLPFPKSDMEEALASNYNLRQMRIALEKARLTYHTNVMSDFPRFKVDAAWSKGSLGILGTPGGSTPGNPNYGVTASVSFPFGFFGLQNYMDLDTQKAIMSSAELEVDDTVRTLKTSVLTSQDNIALQVQSLKLLEFQIKAQKEAEDNLMYEFSQGGSSSLDVDTAQTKLLDARNSKISAVNDLDIALAGYRILLGEKIWE